MLGMKDEMKIIEALRICPATMTISGWLRLAMEIPNFIVNPTQSIMIGKAMAVDSRVTD